MWYFAYICTKVLNRVKFTFSKFLLLFWFGAITQKIYAQLCLFWDLVPPKKQKTKLFLNFGTNVGKITHITPIIREFYGNRALPTYIANYMRAKYPGIKHCAR